jgi:inner membrane protein
MDTLTHALSGALLARATAPAKPPPGALTPTARMTAGFVAAAFPDSDFVLRSIDTLTYLNWHQGVTHSVLLLPFWAFLLAHLFFRLTGRRYSWRAFFVPALLGIAIHIAGDGITAYGPMLLAPISSQRFSLPLAFVIDAYFSAIVAAGLATAIFLPRERHASVVALIMLGCYVAFQGGLHVRAVNKGKAHAAALGFVQAEVHALPQPLSPFNWKIIVSDDDGYNEALVNLLRIRTRRPPGREAGILQRISAAYQPVSLADWESHSRFGETPSEMALAREAWNATAFAGFRRFAMFPVVDRIGLTGEQACVRFLDLRFTLPCLPTSFRYEICRNNATDDWRLRRVQTSYRCVLSHCPQNGDCLGSHELD